jgi:hypothetical protein
MAECDYPAPVDKLLTSGDCREVDKKGWRLQMPERWPNYVEELGLTEAHIPDLIRMVLDDELRWADSESIEVWANTHAWRALGQLRAEAAVEPLIGLLPPIDDDETYDEWASEELPYVFAMIGPICIDPLAEYLADRSQGWHSRTVAMNGLVQIGSNFPATRDRIVAVLMEELEKFKLNDPDVNAYLISSLVDLKATEAAALIRRVFNTKRVDTMVRGDWDDVQDELGIAPPAKSKPKVKRRPDDRGSIGEEDQANIPHEL